MRRIGAILIVISGISGAPLADAAAEAQSGGQSGTTNRHSDLAAQATNPLAPLVQLRFQNYFIADTMDANGVDSSGYANQFDVQGVIPIPKLGFLPRAVFRPTAEGGVLRPRAGDSDAALEHL
jgi:hypothetical protein